MSEFRLRCFGRIALLTLVLSASAAFAENQRGSPGPGEVQTGVITGYVGCDDTGAPARFASVLIIPIPASYASGQAAVAPVLDSALFARLRSHDVAKTNLNGEYTLANISPGTYFVLAELDGYLSPVWQFDEDDLKDMTPETFKTAASLLPTVQVEAGKTVRADITLERGASVSGTVTMKTARLRSALACGLKPPQTTQKESALCSMDSCTCRWEHQTTAEIIGSVGGPAENISLA